MIPILPESELSPALAEVLREARDLVAGGVHPTATALCIRLGRSFGKARWAIRQALDLLIESGLLSGLPPRQSPSPPAPRPRRPAAAPRAYAVEDEDDLGPCDAEIRAYRAAWRRIRRGGISA